MNCKKDNSPQNTVLERLLGTWSYVGDYYLNGVITPPTAGYSQTIEFRKDSFYKEYENGKLHAKYKFTIATPPPVCNSNTLYHINLSCSDFLKDNQVLYTEEIRFGGQDTLFIGGICLGCFAPVCTSIYIRQ